MPLAERVLVQWSQHRAYFVFVEVLEGDSRDYGVQGMLFGQSLFVSFGVLWNVVAVCAAGQFDE